MSGDAPQPARPGARAPTLRHLPWRLAGLVLLGLLVLVYQPDQAGVVDRLLIPAGMAIATWLLVQNLAAVALGAGLLALLHSAPGSADWIVAAAYPVIAGVCAMLLVIVLGARFRRHIAATHEARWQRRRQDHAS